MNDERSGFLWRFILLLLCLMAAAVNTGNNLLYLILSLMIAVAIVSFAAAGRALRRVKAVLHIPEEVAAGRPFIFGVEAIAPGGHLPSPWADAALRGLPGEAPALAIPSLGPGARTVVSGSARVERRGVHGGLSVDLTSRYPFGLFRRRREVHVQTGLVVTPRRRRIRSLVVQAPADHGSLRTGRSGEGSDLFNVREYTTQDDARHIHWKASARLHRPMLKEFEHEQERALEIVLDERTDADPRKDEAFERLVETAASILDHADEKGIRGRIVVPHGDSGFETLEGRAAMIYLASVRRRDDTPHPDRLGGGGGDVPRIVLSLDPSARTEIHVEWAEEEA